MGPSSTSVVCCLFTSSAWFFISRIIPQSCCFCNYFVTSFDSLPQKGGYNKMAWVWEAECIFTFFFGFFHFILISVCLPSYRVKELDFLALYYIYIYMYSCTRFPPNLQAADRLYSAVATTAALCCSLLFFALYESHFGVCCFHCFAGQRVKIWKVQTTRLTYKKLLLGEIYGVIVLLHLYIHIYLLHESVVVPLYALLTCSCIFYIWAEV